MTILNSALYLADTHKFKVFTLIENTKRPAVKDFRHRATSDPRLIEQMWRHPVTGAIQNFNIGISTSNYDNDSFLFVVDVDNKNGKTGSLSVIEMEFEGYEFPDTLKQITPTGGEHLFYSCKEPAKQGVAVFRSDLDARADGGFVVGAGSMIDGKPYILIEKPIVEAPAWMLAWKGRAGQKNNKAILPISGLNQGYAEQQVIYFLKNTNRISIKYHGGDNTAFLVAAIVKDYGVSKETCLILMWQHWNPRCGAPGWSFERLKEKVDNAYNYGTDAVGIRAAEITLSPLPVTHDDNPILKLNDEYALVTMGGTSHILWETFDHLDQPEVKHLDLFSFHKNLAAHTLTLGDGKTKQVSQLWLSSPERRTYNGIVFNPGLPTSPKFYNLWRGFSVNASEKLNLDHPEYNSFEKFLEHARVNVCGNDEKLFTWLMGYFAHIIQKPAEKPLVALVFRGEKGVGKNALIERIGHLLGGHFLVTSNRRYLLGNFNGFLQNLLLFVLDEAFWSGDKQAEGTLKDLITGKKHLIEMKGKEPYTVDNRLRLVIMGNEEWVVPASTEERRFAVFNVGNGKKQDLEFFRFMREGMERGGYSLLLRYLLDFDLNQVNVNQAPKTEALFDQKVLSLTGFPQFWLECLIEGKIINLDFGAEWPESIIKKQLQNAYVRYLHEHNIRGRIITDRSLGRELKKCLSSLKDTKITQDGYELHAYKFPPLEQARLEFAVHVGHDVNWESMQKGGD